jgi:hypothetical protein
LEGILKDATTCHNRRNEYVHARWCIPDKASGGVVRLKFKATVGRDVVEPFTPDEMNNISAEMEKCPKQLRDFFWKFGDYREWLTKRTPFWLTPETPLEIILSPEE